VILVISLPSVAIAWMKLRQRTLGPVLDANGWAINGRVKINIPFGTRLTGHASLPPAATRSLDDPFEDKDAKRRKWLLMMLFLAVAAYAGYAAIEQKWPFNPSVATTKPEQENKPAEAKPVAQPPK
jgi:hypothetical protein